MITTTAIKTFDLSTYQTLVAYNGDIIFEWDLNTDKFSTTSNWFDIFGYIPPSDNFTNTLENSPNIHPEDKQLFKEYLETIQFSSYTRKNGKYYGKLEVRIRNVYHKYVWCKFSLITSYSEQNLPYKISGMITNIDFNKKHQETLVEKAQRDLLTGLYNKATTTQMIEDWLKNSPMDKSGALILIDLDGFKALNDNFGHLFGDAVLADIATTIKNTFVATDIVGRIGGDEFLVFSKEIYSLTVLKKNLKRLNLALSRTYQSNKTTYCISASIGIALHPAHGKDYKKLFAKADQAMYYIKNHGKNDFMMYRDHLPLFLDKKSTNDHNIIVAEKSFNDNLGEYIFKLLSTANNQSAATNLLIEIIGKKLNVCRAFIYEKSPQEESYTKTFEWCDNGTPYFSSKLTTIPSKQFAAAFKSAIHKKVLVCNDTSTQNAVDSDILCMQENQALLLTQITTNNAINGYIGFAEYQHRRQWTEYDVNMATYLADLIGFFWEKSQQTIELTKSQHTLSGILNSLSSPIYIQNPHTKEIVFMNKILQEILHNKYEAIINYDEAQLSSIGTILSMTPIVWLQEKCNLIEISLEKHQ